MSGERPHRLGAHRLAGAWLLLGLGGPAGAAQNRPPEVVIERPADGDAFDWDRLVRYAIRVSDPEDGDSAYDEIQRGAVFLEVVWLPGATPEAARAAAARPDPPGLALMKSSNCFNCHAVNTRVLGPPFAAIAGRYDGSPETRARLARRVRDGAVGEWGDMPMLPHSDFSSEELERMVGWVLERAADPDRRIFAGTEGAFRTRPDPGPGAGGAYRLTASYTDRGAPGSGAARRSGAHTIALRSPGAGQEVSHEE